jgi:large subunit ribosomal protein L25
MRKDITIAAAVRDTRGKNEARRLRADGKIPAVVYGTGQEPVAVAVDPKEVLSIQRSATGHNTIFNVAIEGGETSPVMAVDWQNDPIRGSLLHVDLKRIDMKQRLQVKVPIHTQGEARGVKQQSGLLEVVAREVEIECLPDEIPEQFVVDVTELMIGQNIRAQDLPMTGSMVLLSHGDTVLAHCIALRASEAEAAPAEAAAPVAEPEVIKKGKKEEEGAPEKKK